MQIINKHKEKLGVKNILTYQTNKFQECDVNLDMYSLIYVCNRSRHKIVCLVIRVK